MTHIVGWTRLRRQALGALRVSRAGVRCRWQLHLQSPSGPSDSQGCRRRLVRCAGKVGVAWFWDGDAVHTNRSLMRDFSGVTCIPHEATARAYMPAASVYELLVGNILELTHIDLRQPTTLGRGTLGS